MTSVQSCPFPAIPTDPLWPLSLAGEGCPLVPFAACTGTGGTFSSNNETSAIPNGALCSFPAKTTSLISWPRRCLALCSPNTQRRASTMFDLPQPLGPTTAVMPRGKVSVVRSLKDLNPTSSSCLIRIGPASSPSAVCFRCVTAPVGGVGNTTGRARGRCHPLYLVGAAKSRGSAEPNGRGGISVATRCSSRRHRPRSETAPSPDTAAG